MNLFVTDSCPANCVFVLDDKRVCKMVLETAQLLSNAMLIRSVDGAPYKPTHINHPITKWVANTRGNYEWTLRHFGHLCEEYYRRYEKIHKCAQHLTTFVLALENFRDDQEKQSFICVGSHKLTNKSKEDALSQMALNQHHANSEDIGVFIQYRYILFEKWLIHAKQAPKWYGKSILAVINSPFGWRRRFHGRFEAVRSEAFSRAMRRAMSMT